MAFAPFRNDTIDKWGRKTQLASGTASKFKALNQVCQSCNNNVTTQMEFLRQQGSVKSCRRSRTSRQRAVDTFRSSSAFQPPMLAFLHPSSRSFLPLFSPLDQFLVELHFCKKRHTQKGLCRIMQAGTYASVVLSHCLISSI